MKNANRERQAPSDSRERIALTCVCCGSGSLGRSPAIVMPFVAHRALGWQPAEIDASWGLLTVRQGMAYSICNSVLCNGCGLLFMDIRFSPAELNALYADYRGSDYVSLRERYEPGYARRNVGLSSGVGHVGAVEQFLSPYLPPHPRVLDWGGDTGRNTPFAGSRSVCHVYDISNAPVSGKIQRIDRETAISTKYDLVVCSHVLEHVPYPGDLLQELSDVMSEGTVLYVEVPLEEIMRQARKPMELLRTKRHWHEHINFFSSQSLESLLGHCGMEIIASRELEINAEGKSAAVLQYACRRKV